MADSLSSLTTGLITYTVKSDSQVLKGSEVVTNIRIFKGINRISVAQFEVIDGSAISEDDFTASSSKSFDPGKEIEILAGYDSKEKAIFKGVITKHSLRINNFKSVLLVECRDVAVNMTVGRKNRIFAEKKDSEIVSEILGDYKVSKKIEATSFKHIEMVQHYVTDWDFMLMRADANGQVVIVDDGNISIAAPDPSVAAAVRVAYGTDMISFSGDIDARSQLSSIKGVSWDMSKQQVTVSNSNSATNAPQGSLSSADLAKVVNLKEYTLQTAANTPLAVLDAWTAAKHIKSNLSKVRGTVKFNGYGEIKPGTIIELAGLSPQFNGNAYVGAVEHTIDDGMWYTEVQIGISPEWYAQETPDILAPDASAMYAPIRGLQTALVKQIHEDKDGQYRVKVALPTLEKDNITLWARLSNFYSTADAGVFFYPEIDDEVIVGFLNEDPHNAIILGSVYSSKKKPVYTPAEENFIKGIITKGQLKLEFDDEKKIITVMTPAENKIVIDDDSEKIILQDKNKNIVELSPDGISLTSDKDISIKAGGDVKIEATGNINAKATGDLVGEGMNVTLKGSTKFAAEGAMTEIKGSGQTTIKGGMVMIN